MLHEMKGSLRDLPHRHEPEAAYGLISCICCR